MWLFGGSDGPHMTHFHCVRHDDRVDSWWEVRNCKGLKWRVLRSSEHFAQSAEVSADGSQKLVCEGDVTHFSDPAPDVGKCFYTVFSRVDCTRWERQAAVKVNARQHLSWHHPDVAQEAMSRVDLEANPQATTWGPGSVVRRHGTEFTSLPLTVHRDHGHLDEWLEVE